ncbi:hypothetical protein Q9L58_010695, partial [Maublancomyces gigas]
MMQWENARPGQPALIDRMHWPDAGVLGTPVVKTQPTPTLTPSAPEPSAPGGTKVTANPNTCDPKPEADASEEPLVSGEVPTGESETNEEMEEPVEEEEETEAFIPAYKTSFDRLINYTQGANPTVQYMLCAIRSALTPISARVEQANMAIIALRKTVTNQSSAIAALTAEIRRKNNNPPPPPPPAKIQAPPQQKEKHPTCKDKGKNKQLYADAAKNAINTGF